MGGMVNRKNLNVSAATTKEITTLLWHDLIDCLNLEKLRKSDEVIENLIKLKRNVESKYLQLTRIFDEYKAYSMDLTDGSQKGAFDIVLSDIEDAIKKLQRAQKTLNASISNNIKTKKNLENSKKYQIALNRAKARHKTEDAILSEYLFKISEKIGGPKTIVKFFQKYKEFIPPNLQNPTNENSLKSRIKRYKQFLKN